MGDRIGITNHALYPEYLEGLNFIPDAVIAADAA